MPNPGQPTISLGATGGAGWLANDLDSFGGAPLLPQQSRATLQSPLKQLSVDRVEAKRRGLTIAMHSLAALSVGFER
jgi:hypothetical protein